MSLHASGAWTLSEFSVTIQDEAIREALRPYTVDGSMGYLLDAEEDGLSLSDFTVFEIEELMGLGEKYALPVLLYLFRRIERSRQAKPPLMPPRDIPPGLSEPLTCIIAAATRYDVPKHILLAIAEKEAGIPGQWVRNSNDTSDVGPMQFNTAYLAELAPYGITPEVVANGGCYAYVLAAWRVRRHLLYDIGDVWTRAANYHSRTPQLNAVYRSDLIARSVRWARWLAESPKRRSDPPNEPGMPVRMVSQVAPVLSEASRFVGRKITVSPAD